MTQRSIPHRAGIAAAAALLLAWSCQAQEAPRAGAPPAAAPASAPLRGGSPTPYSAPVAVPSAAGQIRLPRMSPPGVTVEPPPRPTFPSSCDSSGCWGSDGTRYNAVGGSLLRPDGRMCQIVGGVLQCP